MYLKVKEMIKRELALADFVSVSTDHWNSKKHQPFLGVNVHYLLGTKVVDRVLAVREVENKKCEPTANICEKILAEFGKKTARKIVTDWLQFKNFNDQFLLSGFLKNSLVI